MLEWITRYLLTQQTQGNIMNKLPKVILASTLFFSVSTPVSAMNYSESAGMEDYLKLTSDKLTALATKTFAYNKCLSFDSSIPHKNAPISTTPWGTDVSDSPLCFTVFMQTS